VISVPGANGYYNTNYKGKAEYALESLKNNDLCTCMWKRPDEAGHNGIMKLRKNASNILIIWSLVLFREYLKSNKEVRVLIAPDHPTPVAKRTHTANPVPFIMYGPGIESNGTKTYSEQEQVPRELSLAVVRKW